MLGHSLRVSVRCARTPGDSPGRPAGPGEPPATGPAATGRPGHSRLQPPSTSPRSARARRQLLYRSTIAGSSARRRPRRAGPARRAAAGRQPRGAAVTVRPPRRASLRSARTAWLRGGGCCDICSAAAASVSLPSTESIVCTQRPCESRQGSQPKKLPMTSMGHGRYRLISRPRFIGSAQAR